ncbi:MAG TPA: hypothetical protein VFU05_18535 [Cyclobacteriaceae bacterium]|nr:hypothetical protein [Cyclobacteriaceae bacterium]
MNGTTYSNLLDVSVAWVAFNPSKFITLEAMKEDILNVTKKI